MMYKVNQSTKLIGMKTIAVLVVLLVLMMDVSNGQGVEMSFEPRRFCGRRLPETLSKLCQKDVIENIRNIRKALGHSMAKKWSDDTLASDDYFNYESPLFYPDENSVNMKPYPLSDLVSTNDVGKYMFPMQYLHKRSGNPGIIAQCCKKPCTLFDLADYCP